MALAGGAGSAAWDLSGRGDLANVSGAEGCRVRCAAVFPGCDDGCRGSSFFQACDDEDAVKPMWRTYRAGAAFKGMDEYAPLGADNSLSADGPAEACLAASPTTVLGRACRGHDAHRYGTQRRAVASDVCGCHGRVAAEHLRIVRRVPRAGLSGFASAQLSGVADRVNGKPVEYLPERDDGLIAVPVPRADGP